VAAKPDRARNGRATGAPRTAPANVRRLIKGVPSFPRQAYWLANHLFGGSLFLGRGLIERMSRATAPVNHASQASFYIG
jgi:hypothetical protein